MQLFSKKNAKIILAVLVAICLTGCATKAPVDEVVVAPVAPAPVVEAPAPAPAPAPVVEEPVAAPSVDIAPIVEAIESVAKSVVPAFVSVPSDSDASLKATYSVAGYNLVFTANEDTLVFNFVDTFSVADAEVALKNLFAMLPNVVTATMAEPGSMVFEMSEAISADAFESFVNAVCDKAYMAVYAPNAAPAKSSIAVPAGKVTYSADYDLVGYKFSFSAIDNAVVFNYIDSLSAVQNSIIADNVAAMLPNVVNYGIAAPGCVVVEMSSPITKLAFGNFVDRICAKAYDAVYPNASKSSAKSYVAAPAGVATYKTAYDVAGYRISFAAIGNSLVFNYVDVLSADDAENTLRNLSAKLPNVVSCGIAGPGSMVFKMSEPISKAAFDKFVDSVSSKAYKAVYANEAGVFEAVYEMFGYRFVFASNGNVVTINFIDVLSDANKAVVAEALSALLPNVVATSTSVGAIEFKLADTISGYEFDKFVSSVKLAIANDLYPISYNAVYEIAGYRLVFTSVNNYVVFNYLDALSDVELRDAVIALAKKLDAVDYGVAAPGVMVFELNDRISKDAFEGFVAEVSAAAYDVIY